LCGGTAETLCVKGQYDHEGYEEEAI